MKRLAVALALVAASAPAFAEQNPTPGARDPRVRTIAWDPNNVVRLEAADLRSTMLQFGADETVDIVAIGDPNGWAWNKARNLLFIKPTLSPADPSYALRVHTNMQVVTLKPSGEQRIYVFELIARPAPGSTDQPIMALNMTYPSDVTAAKRKAAAEAAATHDEDVARQRLMVGYQSGPGRRWEYVGRGSPEIEPADVSYDPIGNTTAFRFAGNSAQPAIWKGQCNKSDQLSQIENYLGDIVVVQGGAPFWCLRLGENTVFEVAAIRFDPVGQNPDTGTTSPDVVRRIKRASR